MKRIGLVALTTAVLLTGGCGADEETASNGSGGGAAVSGCLSPDQVTEEISRIAEGAEGSSAEVKAKQSQIQAVEDEAC